eukprot:COSAG01_NODE_24097_length_790_cov_1.675832_1_plen_47_part_10
MYCIKIGTITGKVSTYNQRRTFAVTYLEVTDIKRSSSLNCRIWANLG